MTRIALFTAYGEGFPIGFKLQEEGHEVYVGQVQDFKELHLNLKEKPKEREARLSLYDGLIKKKWSASRLTSYLLGSGKQRDWFILCDFNVLWPYAERLKRAGFRGLLPSKQDHMLEHDRNAAHDLIKKLYPDVETGDYQEFKATKDGIKFLEENDEKLYVLKGFNADAETIVPLSNDPDDNREMLIDALERDNDHFYEKDGYVLEEKIEDAIEFTPEAIAFDGEIRSVSVDIEHKRLGSRSGPLTGCAMDALFWQDDNQKLYDMFLAPLENMMLRKNELTIWDLSVFYSPSRGEFYAGEFCSNRMGYNSVFNEIATYQSVTDWLDHLLTGAEKEREDVGVSVRVFNLDKKQKIFIGDPADRNVWCFDIHKDGDKLRAAGYDKNAYCLTASADNIESAIDELYEFEQNIEFDPGLMLEKHDWHDSSFHDNILNRVEVLTSLDLLKTTGDKYGNKTRTNKTSSRRNQTSNEKNQRGRGILIPS